MKYAIITPTFKSHFKYIDKYLESYDKFVQDKDEIELVFTISKNETKYFQKIVNKYPNVLYKVVLFEELLKKYNIDCTPDQLLKKYKKYTFQTLKKFYSMLDSDADYFLVLDSESMWIKDTKMTDLFKNFFNSPFLTYSKLEKRNSISQFTTNVILNANYLLNMDCNKWFLENFIWFYDKKILEDLFNEIGSPIELANKIYSLDNIEKTESGIFEIILYQDYIYKNNNRYNYRLINSDELLELNLTHKDYEDYMKIYHNTFNGNFGILEQTMLFLNDSNLKPLALLFKQNNFNIIRCDYTNIDNFVLQNEFLNIVQPNILAASQDHAFGINNKIKILLRNNKSFKKLVKHFKAFKSSFKLLSEIFSVIYYFICSLFSIPKFVIEIIKIINK